MELEIWKDIPGFEGYYQVSNKGNVKSLSRFVNKGKGVFWKEGKTLSKIKTACGYYKVDLKVNGKRITRKIHRFVALAFLPKIEGKEIINHKDGNPINNNVENLEWCTHKENVKHALENQLKPNNFHKYKEEIKKDYLENGLSLLDLAKKYKVSKNSIKPFFKESGIEIKGNYVFKNKYKIDKIELSKDFIEGKSNKELAEKYKTNANLISTYKNKWKKGELI